MTHSRSIRSNDSGPIGLPLVPHRERSAIVAWRRGQPVTVAELLRDIEVVAAALPRARYVINLCHDRYRFLVAFGAALSVGATSLFPPNHTEGVLAEVANDYPGCACITEGPMPPQEVATVSIGELVTDAPRPLDGVERVMPQIAPSFVAALVFTSGSTGKPRPNAKTWGRLIASAQAEAQALELDREPFYLVGTVPPQHMYGFESTIFLPLVSGGALHAARPLFAADVAAALAELPAPRVLVTTPVHIRACIEDAAQLPELELILSAAAPLPREWAERAELAFGTRLHEIYGFTEAGMVASRRTTAGDAWTTLPGVSLTRDGDQWNFEGGHVAGRIPVADVITVESPQRFTLEGRPRDAVNVAGKRGSLADLNHKLNAIPGVRDGVFHIPTAADGKVARLMAFVVAPELTEAQILEALRRTVDAAFLPRPLVKVERLPRAATGKLPLDALRALEATVDR